MKKPVCVVSSIFKLLGRGMIIELKHSENGLPKNTELLDEYSESRWRITGRILFEHAAHEQRIFESETIEYMMMKFQNPDEELRSITAIKNQELRNEYQYFIQSISHNNIPQVGYKLIIHYPM